jgi:hypothetical protein
MFPAALIVSFVDPAVIIVGLVGALCWREGWKLAAAVLIVVGAAGLTSAMDATHRIPMSEGAAWVMIFARSIAAAIWAVVIAFLIDRWKRARPE